MLRKIMLHISQLLYSPLRCISNNLGPKMKNALALMRWYKENKLLYGPLREKNKQNTFFNKFVNESNNVLSKPRCKGIRTNDTAYDIDYVNNIQSHMRYIHNGYDTNSTLSSNSIDTSRDNISLDQPSALVRHLDLITSAPILTEDSENTNPEYLALPNVLINDALVNVPSVSRILSSTRTPENEMFLERWKRKMIEQMGEEAFKQYQDDTLRRGINFHACIQSFLSGGDIGDIQLDDENRGHWDSIQTVLGNVENVKLVESRVTHPYLQYAGTFDCLATYTTKNSLCLIDWKTSQKPKPLLSHTYDHPLQAAAYMGALNHDPQQLLKVRSALIVIAYADGANAHAHYMDERMCHKYWMQWLSRLQLYWKQVLTQTKTDHHI